MTKGIIVAMLVAGMIWSGVQMFHGLNNLINRDAAVITMMENAGK